MATKTEEFLTGTGTSIGFTTQYINESDIKVRVDGGNPLTFIGTTGTPATGQYKIAANSTTINFGDNQNGKSLHIYSETDVSSPTVSFTPGSSIKAADLNALETLVRHGIKESRNEIVTSDLRDEQITSSKIKDGTIVDGDIASNAAIAQTKIATGTLPSGIQVASANIVNGTIVNDDVSSSANIQGSKLADDSVPLTKLGGGTLPSDIDVTSTNIQDGTITNIDISNSAAIAHGKLALDIVNSDINASADIAGSKLANDSVGLSKLGGGALPTDITITTNNIVDGTIVNADIKSDAGIAYTKLQTGVLPADRMVNSANIVDGSIVDADINASADIQGSKLLNDSVSLDKLGSGNLPTDIKITQANITAGNIVDADINASADIQGTKLKDDSVPLTKFGAGALPTDITVASANIVDGTIVNADINASANIAGSKLANDSVTLDKLGSGALPTDITVASTNIVNGTIVNADINASAEIEGSKLLNDSVTLDKLGSGNLPTDINVSNSNIVTGTLDGRYYTETELNAGQLDNRYFTETELTNGALDGRYYTETEAEAKFLRQDSSETIASGATWSNSDAFVATTAAINARIIDLIDDVGGFTAITNQLSFPTTNPQGSTGQAAILSIGATTATLTPSSGTITIANGAGTGNTVTITGAPTIPQGFGFLVNSTSTLHTYTFHRLVPIATQVDTVATNITNIVNAGANVADINNFADIYIISASEPTTRNDSSSLQEGDLWYDSSNDNLLVYTGSAFAIITPNQTVLDNVATVSGAITYSEDLGLITQAVATGSSNGSLDIVADALEDEVTFTITVSGGKYLIDGVSAPALTLYKGWTYTFDVSDSSNSAHPLRFYAGSSQYSTGVTVTGSQGNAGAKVQIVIPESQPANFQYYCTNHSGMGNTITVKDDPIKTVSDNVVKIIAAADNQTNINAVQANASNINAVQANSSNINAAVSNASNINAVVSNATNINTVAGNNSNITAVAGNNTNITAVKNNATNINTVAGINANVTTVAGISSDVTTVAGKNTEIGRLGTADAVADMNTLGTTAIVSDMDTLADISSDITTVSGINSNVTTVAGISGNVTTVANNNANVTAVAGNATNINAVKNNATNINAVNANKTNIDAVAGNNSNITAVANNSSNINSAVSNASNINAAVANASNINSVVSNATNINTTAANITDVNTFANRYRIGSTNPTSSLDVGDLFFNTSANELRIYNGSQWQGGVTATGNFATTAGVIFTGDNRYNDNIKAKYGNDSDLQIFHNTTDSIINASGVGNIKLQDSGNTKLEVTSSGIGVTGNISVSGTVDGKDISGLGISGTTLDNGVVATTQSQSDNSTKVATTAYVRSAVSNLVDSAPGTLDTLNELAAALGDDSNFATTTANSLGTKAPINNPTFTGTVTAGTIDGTNLTLDFGTL